MILKMERLVNFLCLFLSLANTASSVCPDSCECLWKHGKIAVDCIRVELDALPEPIDKTTQVLDLSYNLIQRLPARTFAAVGLVNIQKLTLKGCGLKQVDAQAFVELTNLVYLDLSENKLSVIPDAALRQTVSLNQLDLHGNAITFVPGELPTELTHLDLSHCKITTIHIRAFIKLKRLKELKLDHNKLVHFETGLVLSLSGLHNIDIHMNPWNCNCQLRALYGWLKDISHSTSPTCHRPQRLKGQSFNQIKLRSLACPPQVLITGERANGKSGGNITAWCPVAGLPTPTVSWFYGDIPIYNTSRVGSGIAYIINEASEEKGSLLLLSGATERDTGTTLRCVATNAAGAATAQFTLKVERSSRFLFLSYEQLIGLSCAIVIGSLISCCVCCIYLARKRKRKPTTKINGNLVLTFPTGGSVVAARTPEDNEDEFESEYRDDVEEYSKVDLSASRHNSFVTTLIDSGGDENEELIHRTPVQQRPLTGVWPAQALALLDSAAPEHIMYSTMGRSNRQSLLPDFAPDYSNSWSCHFSTLPRKQRQDTSSSQFHQQKQFTPDSSLPNFMTNSSIPTPCPPPPPLSPQNNSLLNASCSISSGPMLMSQQNVAVSPPMSNLHTKLNRITARDSPDEGYQEGTDV